jgi:hypothetical protein
MEQLQAAAVNGLPVASVSVIANSVFSCEMAVNVEVNEMYIGLVGAKGAGKTTVFNMLRELNPDLMEITLAKKLKDVCSEALDIPRADFDDPLRKELRIAGGKTLGVFALTDIYGSYDLEPRWDFLGRRIYSAREAAQLVGTELLRAVDPEIHLKWAIKGLDTSKSHVITDIRFPNEFSFFQDRGDFRGIYIMRDIAEAAAASDKHASESHLDTLKKLCHFQIDNSREREYTRMLVSQLYELGLKH